MSKDLTAPLLSVRLAGFLSDMLTAAFGTTVGIVVLTFPRTFAIDANSAGGRALAIALALATAGLMAGPMAFLNETVCRRIEDRHAEKSLPITDDLAREIAALVNAGEIRQANRLTRRTVDPQSAAFAACRYIDVD